MSVWSSKTRAVASGVRAACCFDELVDAAFEGIVASGGIPLRPAALCSAGVSRGRRERRLLGIGDDGFQQGLEVTEQPLDGRASNRSVLYSSDHAQLPVRSRQSINCRSNLAVIRSRRPSLRSAALATPRRIRRILQHEHHLENRGMAETALGLQLVHQLLERQILVRIRSQRRLTHPTQQLHKARISRQVAAQRQGVHEETDQPSTSERVRLAIGVPTTI